ncbi:DUF4302 domain-containing protein [uncultured Sanguibacteroides sp.]|uniref:DUF4302 domain-containing protein n=1 Tax=uncultured Sanguibacteroides sp. TaxID=1635151 RepID=UPI0025DAB469|nr:DUF4302 domain-containing protein [uncultured Sanguibacteroides sp.]
MKTITFLLLICTAFVVSCRDNEVDDLFELSPEARIAQRISEIQNELVTAKEGWITHYIYNESADDIYLKIIFKENNRAEITYSKKGKIITEESSYAIRYSQQVDLIFDTYSVFATLVNSLNKGDFRFEFDRKENGLLYFKSRSSTFEPESYIEFEPNTGTLTYEKLLAMYNRLLPDPNKPFYRVMNIQGANTKFCLWRGCGINLEWEENNVFYTQHLPIKITDDGFEFRKPFQVNNTNITRLVYNETDDNFEIWSEQTKVGSLDYTEQKPCRFGNSTEEFLKEVGGFVVIEYSGEMQNIIDLVYENDPDFYDIEFYVNYGKNEDMNELNFYSEEWGYLVWDMDFQYDKDIMTMNVIESQSEEADEYATDIAPDLYRVFADQAFTLVKRNGKYWFIQNNDPRIYMLVEPL